MSWDTTAPERPWTLTLEIDNGDAGDDGPARWVIRGKADAVGARPFIASFAECDRDVASLIITSVNMRDDVAEVIENAHEFVEGFVDGAPDAGITAHRANLLERDLFALITRVAWRKS